MKKSRLILYIILLIAAILLLRNVLSYTENTPVQATDKDTMTSQASIKNAALLSAHHTIASFDGIKEHKCLGMTSLCPDKCGHSGKLAAFTIKRYVNYAKLGEYGDPEQKTFFIMINNTLDKSETTPENVEIIKTLMPGDLVLLGWNHIYITDQGNSYPERPITVIKKLTEEEKSKELSTTPTPQR